MESSAFLRIDGAPGQSDYVVTYITHSWGGAYLYAEKARRQKKVVTNL